MSPHILKAICNEIAFYSYNPGAHTQHYKQYFGANRRHLPAYLDGHMCQESMSTPWQISFKMIIPTSHVTNHLLCQ